jgi:thioredoxin 1
VPWKEERVKVLATVVLAVLACATAADAGALKLAQNTSAPPASGATPSEEPGAKILNDAVINPKSSALVFFRAGWCYPCKKMASNLSAVATLPIIEIDVDANPNLARKYDLKNLPTVLLFLKGSQVDQKVGILSESEISTWVKKAPSGR